MDVDCMCINHTARDPYWMHKKSGAQYAKHILYTSSNKDKASKAFSNCPGNLFRDGIGQSKVNYQKGAVLKSLGSSAIEKNSGALR